MNELRHYGVKGMKWGVRRYQNKDGSLTPAGKKRQAIKEYRREFDEMHKNDSRFKKAMNKLYGVDKTYARQKYIGVTQAKEATDRALKEIGGKPAFTYKGKTYYYSKNQTPESSNIEMIGPDGKSMGKLWGRAVDIDLDTWNKLDDRYIEYSKY